MFQWKSGFIKSVLILLLILATSVTVMAENDTSEPSTPPCPADTEIIDARTSHTKLFKDNDNQDTLFISMMPLHYRDTTGKWRDIDTSFEETNSETDEDGERFGYRVVKNTFESYLPRNHRGWVQLRTGDCRISFRLLSNTDVNKIYRTKKKTP